MLRAARIAPAALVAIAAFAIAAPAQAGAAPRTGDWEAAASSGAQASFAVVTAHRRVHGTVQRYLAVQDLVVNAPITCANSFGAASPFDLEVIRGMARLNAHGNFVAGKFRKGRGTKVTGRFVRGHLRLTYRHAARMPNLVDGGTEVCDTHTIALTAAHSHRRRIADGVWNGKTQDNEPVELDVVAGGRALATRVLRGQPLFAFQVQPASQLDDCPNVANGGTGGGGGDGTETGLNNGAAFQLSDGLFIQPNGSFDNGQLRFGDSQLVNGVFTRAKAANGVFANPTQGCSWTWSAKPQ